jgi:hypothetical protein
MANAESIQEFKQRVETDVERLNAQIAELEGKLKQQEEPTAVPKVLEPRRDPYQEFLDKNGGERAMVWVATNRWLLPTGAKVMNDGYLMQLTPPPRDELGNNQARRAYAVANLERVERDFEQLKGALTGVVSEHGMQMRFEWPDKRYGPMPTSPGGYGRPDGETQLLRLKQFVEQRRVALAAIDDEPIARKRREAEAANRQSTLDSQAQAQDQRNRINAIQI